MSIGQQYIIRIHEDDAGAVVFDSVVVKEFTHANGFVGATTVKKEDFTGTPNDAFVVQITYPAGSLPVLSSTSMDDLLTLATDAVNAEFGDGEAGDPTS